MDQFLQRRWYLNEKQHELTDKRSFITNLLDFYGRLSSSLVKRSGWINYFFFLEPQKSFENVFEKKLVKRKKKKTLGGHKREAPPVD